MILSNDRGIQSLCNDSILLNRIYGFDVGDCIVSFNNTILCYKQKQNQIGLSTPCDIFVVLWHNCYGFCFQFAACQKINHKSDVILFLFVCF